MEKIAASVIILPLIMSYWDSSRDDGAVTTKEGRKTQDSESSFPVLVNVGVLAFLV